MDELTLEQFKEQHKDLYASVQKQGFDAGVQEERRRSVEILKRSKAFSDMDYLAFESVEQGKTIDQAVISFQEKQLAELKKESPENPGPDNDVEKKEKLTHLQRAEIYRKEHNCSMSDALQATAEKHQ